MLPLVFWGAAVFSSPSWVVLQPLVLRVVLRLPPPCMRWWCLASFVFWRCCLFTLPCGWRFFPLLNLLFGVAVLPFKIDLKYQLPQTKSHSTTLEYSKESCCFSLSFLVVLPSSTSLGWCCRSPFLHDLKLNQLVSWSAAFFSWVVLLFTPLFVWGVAAPLTSFSSWVVLLFTLSSSGVLLLSSLPPPFGWCCLASSFPGLCCLPPPPWGGAAVPPSQLEMKLN